MDTAYFKVELSSSPDFRYIQRPSSKRASWESLLGIRMSQQYPLGRIGDKTHVRIKAVDFAGNDLSGLLSSNLMLLNLAHPAQMKLKALLSLASPASPALMLLGAALLGRRRRETKIHPFVSLPLRSDRGGSFTSTSPRSHGPTNPADWFEVR